MGKSVLAAYNEALDAIRPSATTLADVSLKIRNQLHRDKLEVLVGREKDLREAVKQEGIDPGVVLALADFVKIVLDTGLGYPVDRPLSELSRDLKAARDSASRNVTTLTVQRSELEAKLSVTKKTSLKELSRKLKEQEEELSRLRNSVPLRQESLMSIEAVDAETALTKENLTKIESRSAEYEKLTYALEVQRDVPILLSERATQYRQRDIPTRDVGVLHIRRPNTSRTTGQLLGDFAFSHRITNRKMQASDDFTRLAQEHEKVKEHLSNLAEQKQILRHMGQIEKKAQMIRGELVSKAGRDAKVLTGLIESESRAQERLTLIDKALGLVTTGFRLTSSRRKSISDLAKDYLGATVRNLAEAHATLSVRRPRVEALDVERKAIEYSRNQYLANIIADQRFSRLAKEIQQAVQQGQLRILSDFVDRLAPISDPAWLELIRTDVERAILSITNPTSGERERSADSFYQEMNRLLGHILSTLLNEVPFQEFVFEGRKVERVDPAAGTVVLKSNGSSLTQSLEDFSSGQRAFAYSLASINSKKREAPHSLLILDEFGALLDEERTKFLREHVRSLMESTKWPGTTVIVFPYKGELEQRRRQLTTEKMTEAKRQEELLKVSKLETTLDEDGYYVEVLL